MGNLFGKSEEESAVVGNNNNNMEPGRIRDSFQFFFIFSSFFLGGGTHLQISFR